MLAANSFGSAEVSGAPETFASVTLVYQFNKTGGLTLAYAPPFNESAGQMQKFMDFNSFLNHKNTLEIFNSTDLVRNGTVLVIDFQNQTLSQQPISLTPRATQRLDLALPTNSYGTIIVDSGADLGLVVRNDVERSGEYILPFPGR